MKRPCANCGALQKHVFVIEARDFRRNVGFKAPLVQRDFCTKSCYCEFEQHDRTPWRKPCEHCK